MSWNTQESAPSQRNLELIKLELFAVLTLSIVSAILNPVWCLKRVMMVRILAVQFLLILGEVAAQWFCCTPALEQIFEYATVGVCLAHAMWIHCTLVPRSCITHVTYTCLIILTHNLHMSTFTLTTSLHILSNVMFYMLPKYYSFIAIAILIPKTIGNIKRDCAWGCARSGDKHHTRKICRSQSTNQSGERNERLPVLCVAICRFSRVVFILRAQPHAQSLFLFPIVFGINLIIFSMGRTIAPLERVGTKRAKVFGNGKWELIANFSAIMVTI